MPETGRPAEPTAVPAPLTPMPFPPSGHQLPPDRPLRITASALPDGTALLRLAGELDMAGAPELERRVRAAAPRAGGLALDLRDLEFMDSSGLSAIVRLEEEVRAGGGRLWCLVPPEGPVRKLIELTQISEVLDVREEWPETG